METKMKLKEVIKKVRQSRTLSLAVVILNSILVFLLVSLFIPEIREFFYLILAIATGLTGYFFVRQSNKR